MQADSGGGSGGGGGGGAGVCRREWRKPPSKVQCKNYKGIQNLKFPSSLINSSSTQCQTEYSSVRQFLEKLVL